MRPGEGVFTVQCRAMAMQPLGPEKGRVKWPTLCNCNQTNFWWRGPCPWPALPTGHSASHHRFIAPPHHPRLSPRRAHNTPSSSSNPINLVDSLRFSPQLGRSSSQQPPINLRSGSALEGESSVPRPARPKSGSCAGSGCALHEFCIWFFRDAIPGPWALVSEGAESKALGLSPSCKAARRCGIFRFACPVMRDVHFPLAGLPFPARLYVCMFV